MAQEAPYPCATVGECSFNDKKFDSQWQCVGGPGVRGLSDALLRPFSPWEPYVYAFRNRFRRPETVSEPVMVSIIPDSTAIRNEIGPSKPPPVLIIDKSQHCD